MFVLENSYNILVSNTKFRPNHKRADMEVQSMFADDGAPRTPGADAHNQISHDFEDDEGGENE